METSTEAGPNPLDKPVQAMREALAQAEEILAGRQFNLDWRGEWIKDAALLMANLTRLICKVNAEWPMDPTEPITEAEHEQRLDQARRDFAKAIEDLRIAAAKDPPGSEERNLTIWHARYMEADMETDPAWEAKCHKVLPIEIAMHLLLRQVVDHCKLVPLPERKMHPTTWQLSEAMGSLTKLVGRIEDAERQDPHTTE